ncbi:MAG: EcsC family protein, partial [Methylobacteriaceae bacterium]|nr:EcsC family protein [Methylobacteriaceae bacterium]
AVRILEGSTLTGRLSALAGRPLEMLGRTLPAPAMEVVTKATEAALKAALKVALTSLTRGRVPGGVRVHRVAAAASGALGGSLGLATLPVELPLSTIVMLRAIAEIAREEGEDLSDPATALACLEVFALGSRTERDDLAQSGYFAVRGALAKTVTEAARVAASRGLSDRGGPIFVRLIGQIASRFGIVVSQKVAAAAVPVVGAVSGAALNAAFLEHFRAVARAHFTVRRLERQHGEARVDAAYEEARLALT